MATQHLSSVGVPSDDSTHLLAAVVLDQQLNIMEPEMITYLADCYPSNLLLMHVGQEQYIDYW